MNCEEAARLIGPYLDGELDLTACLETEAHLAACPSCREKLDLQRALITVVQEEMPRHKAPAFLATRIRASLKVDQSPTETIPWRQPWPVVWTWSGLAGALALLALMLVFSKPGTSSSLAQEAIADHVRSLQVNHLLDVASTDQHTVKPWFAGKLDYSPQVADLGPSGYPLIGGRLDVLDHHDVAAIVYQRRKHFINLFIWPANKSPLGERYYEQDGYHVLEWTKSGMNYLAVSELGEKELRDFTEMIKNQTTPPME